MSATVFYNSANEFATCSNVFKVGGIPTDPTAVTLTITAPAGVVTVYNWPGGPNTLSHAGPGAFTQDVPCNSAVDGIWVYQWDGTGTASDTIKGTWTVGPSGLNQNYCTAEELKSRLRLAGTGDDFEIAWAVAAASRGIDRYCDRYFYRGPDTRTYVPDSLYQVCTGDIVSVATLATDPSGTAPQSGTFPVTWPAGSWQLLPYNPGDPGEPWPYTKIKAVGGLTFPWVTPRLLARLDRVQVTGTFGWPAVPAQVKQAALITAAELFRARDLPLGGELPGEGLAVAVISSSRVISGMLGPYQASPFLAA